MFYNIIGDVNETFRITTLPINQKLVQKSWFETSTCDSASNSKNYSVNHGFFSFGILQPNVWYLISKQRGNWQFTTKNASFSQVIEDIDM